MRYEETQSLALRLKTAGYKVEVIMDADKPLPICYSIIARMVDAGGECWMFLHIRDEMDAAALDILLPGATEGRHW